MSGTVPPEDQAEANRRRAAHLAAHRWKPGQSGNPGGSPVGYRKSLQGDFLKMLSEDFKVHGRTAIVNARLSDPIGYVKTIAALLPKELEITRPLGALTDDELTAIVERLQSAISFASHASGVDTPGELQTTQ